MTVYSPDELAHIASVLDELDSHGIYAVPAVAGWLREAGWRDPLPDGMTHRQTFAAIAARGLGGALAQDTGENLIAGYVVSRWVASYVLGHAPGDAFMGRGSAHRANVAAIRAAAAAAGPGARP